MFGNCSDFTLSQSQLIRAEAKLKDTNAKDQALEETTQTMREELTKSQRQMLLAESEGAQTKAELAKVRFSMLIAMCQGIMHVN